MIETGLISLVTIRDKVSVIMESSYTGTNIDEIMLNRRVFVRNERIWQKKRRSASRNEILIIKICFQVTKPVISTTIVAN